MSSWDTEQRLGAVPDSQLARLTNTSRTAVRQARIARGIPAVQIGIDIEQARQKLAACSDLGRVADDQISAALGCSPWLVTEVRQEQGIPARISFLESDLMELPDVELARKYNATLFEAFSARSSAGYPRKAPRRINHDWESEKRLGTISDSALALEIGCSQRTVTRHRTRLGIPRFTEIDWDQVTDLGVVSDAIIAERLGCSERTVAKHRRHKTGTATDWDSVVSDWGVLTDQKIADKLGVDRTTVTRHRSKLGIKACPPESYQRQSRFKWDTVLHRLGKEPDKKVAKRLGCSERTVKEKRWRLGIPNYWDPVRAQKVAAKRQRQTEKRRALRAEKKAKEKLRKAAIRARKKAKRDRQIAELEGRIEPPIEKKSYNDADYDWDSVIHMVGNVPDLVVAERVGCTSAEVYKFRMLHDISPARVSSDASIDPMA